MFPKCKNEPEFRCVSFMQIISRCLAYTKRDIGKYSSHGDNVNSVSFASTGLHASNKGYFPPCLLFT